MTADELRAGRDCTPCDCRGREKCERDGCRVCCYCGRAMRPQTAAVCGERVFTDDECFRLNAGQHPHPDPFRRVHPYTCGNDSRHRPLIATPTGWRCADCDYRQTWAHGVGRSIAEGGAR